MPATPLYEVVKLPAENYVREAVTNTVAPNSFNYHYQLIVPLSNDHTVMLSATRLFAKRPYRSVFVATGGSGEIEKVYGWTAELAGGYRALDLYRLPQAFGVEGSTERRIRISLVGHGESDFKHLVPLYRRVGRVVDSVLATPHIDLALLNLVGCQMFDPLCTVRSGRAGRIAEWLMERADAVIAHPQAREKVAVHARSFVIQVASGGRKRSLLRLSIRGEDRDVFMTQDDLERLHVLYKARLRWDKARRRLTLDGASTFEYQDSIERFNPDFEDAQGWPGAREVRRRLSRELLNSFRSCLTGPDVVVPDDAHRRHTEALLRRCVTKMGVFTQWRRALSTLGADVESGSLIHLPENVRGTLPNLEVGLHALDSHGRVGDTVIWRAADHPVFVTMRDEAVVLRRELAGALKVNTSRGWSDIETATRGERLTTLDAAFLLHALLTFDNTLRGRSCSRGLALQIYSSMATQALGLATNGLSLVQNIYLLAESSSAMFDAMALMSRRLGALASHVLDGVMVYGAVQQLMAASTETERNVAVTSVATAALSIGMTTGGLVAAKAGMSVVGELLQAIGAPIAGISIGIAELVRSYSGLSESVSDALHEIARRASAVKNTSVFANSDGTLKLTEGAVVKTVDLNLRRLRLGDVGLRSIRPVAHFTLGHWPHFGSLPSAGDSAVSLYRALEIETSCSLPAAGTLQGDFSAIILPQEPDVVYGYAYVQAPGVRWREADLEAVEQLNRHFPEKFCWGMYVFPTDYAIARLKPMYGVTRILLDARLHAMTIVVPQVNEGIKRSRLHYAITIDRPTTLVLPGDVVSVDLIVPEPGAIRVTIDATGVFASQAVDGDEPKKLDLHALSVTTNGLSIGAHHIIFSRAFPSRVDVICLPRVHTAPSLTWGIEPTSAGAPIARWRLSYDSVQAMQSGDLSVVPALRNAGLTGRQLDVLLAVASRQYTGRMDLETGFCVVLCPTPDGQSTNVMAGQRTFDLPGLCKLVTRPDMLAAFAIQGAYGGLVEYRLVVGEDEPRVDSATLSPADIDRALVGTINAVVAGPAYAEIFAGAVLTGLDSSGRHVSLRKRSDRWSPSIEWRRNGVLYHYDNRVLVLHCTAGAIFPQCDSTIEPTDRIRINGITQFNSLDLVSWLDRPGTIAVDMAGMTHAQRMQIGAGWQPSSLRVSGADLILCEGRTERLILCSVFGRSRSGALTNISIQGGGPPATVGDVMKTLRIDAAQPPIEHGIYLGTNAEGVHFFVDVPSRRGAAGTVRLCEQDALETTLLDLQGTEPLAEHQPFVVSHGYLKGVSGKTYRVDAQGVSPVPEPLANVPA